MTREQKSIGQKIFKLRKKKKISLEDLSEKTGLEVDYLQKVEEDESIAPVGDIIRISRALTIDPGDLLEKNEGDKIQKRKRAEELTKRESSYFYSVLTPNAKNKHLRAFQVTIPPKSEHPKISYKHEGEEFIYVLKGEVEIIIGQKTHLLKKDDSLHFNSNLKHSLKNPGTKMTLLLVTVYTP